MWQGTDSILEWLLIPHLAQIREAAGGQRIHLYDMRSRDVVAGLINHTLDFGIVRKTAVISPLKFRPVCDLNYALFVPSSWPESDAKALLERSPVAIPEGGEFSDNVQALAAKCRLKLNFAYYCTSLTQSSQLVRWGVSGAIFPDIATDSLGGAARVYELPWLSSYRRRIGIAWHERLVLIRPRTKSLLDACCELLQRKGEVRAE